jgi:hypothetical protein
MTNISGMDWETAWFSKEEGTYGGVPVFFLGRGALIANELAAGRAKDAADVGGS